MFFNLLIKKRRKIEPKNFDLCNRYELLIYAAIWVEDKKLLIKYIDKVLERPVRAICQSEYLKPSAEEPDVTKFFGKIKELARDKNFKEIQRLVSQLEETSTYYDV